MEDDRRNRGGLFQTGPKGTVPPLVTTSFIAEDQGRARSLLLLLLLRLCACLAVYRCACLAVCVLAWLSGCLLGCLCACLAGAGRPAVDAFYAAGK